MISQASKQQKVESLIRESWSVSWPMVLSMLMVFAIGLADVYVAGKISKEVQASYGLVSQIYFIFSIIAFALTIGAVSVIARLFTSTRKKECALAVDSSLLSAVVMGACVSTLAFIFSPSIINQLAVPVVLKQFGTPLMLVYASGLLFNYVLLNTGGILRACGMIRKSLFTMVVVCVLNIALNFFLTFFTPFGFRGIAVATVISTALGCLLNIVFLRPVMSGGRLQFSSLIMRKILSIGWPAGLLQIFWQLAALALFLILGALPQHSVEILAAFTNGLKIESAIFLPAFAFNMAAAVVVGNLLGKQNKQDAFKGGIVTALLGVAIVTVLTVIVMFNASRIARMLSNNEFVVQECVRYIVIALLFEPIMAWSVVLGGALNGAGDTKSVMVIVALCVWLLRVPLSYVFVVHMGLGPVAVWWAMNLSVFAQAVFITWRYVSRKWMVNAHIEFVA